MANRIEGVTEKLLEQAMKEFLEKGYTGASLRTIAENADTTPRSVYTRYGDKEGLFSALVFECAEKLKAMFSSYMDEYDTKPVDEQKNLFHDDSFDTEYKDYISLIIDYIYEHHNEKLTLRELAEKEHFSEGYLSKLITAGTGLGFRELLAFARVEESEKILLSGSDKISSISAQVGFSTTAYYEKFFKKWFGCHPEEYRKMYSDRIKGNSSEITFELSDSEAMPVIQRSIKNVSFASGENNEKQKRDGLIMDVTQDQKEILDAYKRTNRSHEEILQFMLGQESKKQ